MANILEALIHLEQTTRLLHWKTKKYSFHIDTDLFHKKLLENIDRFAEVMLGIDADALNNFGLQVTVPPTFIEDNLVDEARTVGIYIQRNRTSDPGLDAICDEILNDINQFLYRARFY